MRLGYTEFSFGYAFTENLIRSTASKPVGAPAFPNLIQEARLGYDVRIDYPACALFFQYKLPELMVRNTAAEIALHRLAGIAVPFFRMPLMRRSLSRQHELLIDLESRFPGSVYYATPGIPDSDRFNAAYTAADVHRQSVFFSPGAIGLLPNDAQHVIAYRPGSPVAWVCSDPKEVPAMLFDDVMARTKGLLDQSRFGRLGDLAELIREEIITRISPGIRDAEEVIRRRLRATRTVALDRESIDEKVLKVVEHLLVSRELARVGLGLEMVIAQPSSAEHADRDRPVG